MRLSIGEKAEDKVRGYPINRNNKLTTTLTLKIDSDDGNNRKCVLQSDC